LFHCLVRLFPAGITAQDRAGREPGPGGHPGRRIQGSQLRHNISGKFETSGFPGIFFLGAGRPQVSS
jgi:hypothetical protein